MKQNKKSLALGLCALVLLSLVIATNVFAVDEVTITGTVYPIAWDDNDNVIAAVISGPDEDYAIVDNAIGRKLSQQTSRDVKATGIVGKDSEGNKNITVVKYEIMME